jgi:hypothetical protein
MKRGKREKERIKLPTQPYNKAQRQSSKGGEAEDEKKELLLFTYGDKTAMLLI